MGLLGRVVLAESLPERVTGGLLATGQEPLRVQCGDQPGCVPPGDGCTVMLSAPRGMDAELSRYPFERSLRSVVGLAQLIPAQAFLRWFPLSLVSSPLGPKVAIAVAALAGHEPVRARGLGPLAAPTFLSRVPILARNQALRVAVKPPIAPGGFVLAPTDALSVF